MYEEAAFFQHHVTDQMADCFSIRKSGNKQDSALSRSLEMAFDQAMARESYVSKSVLAMNGMSGVSYRMFINNLVRLTSNARYLEIGSWAGSTACSAVDKNVLRAVCIDDWSQLGGPRDEFRRQISAVLTQNVNFTLIEMDFRKVDAINIGRSNIYLFDGPHEEADQYDGLALYLCALDRDFVFIVDDWNWDFVRRGTYRAINDNKLEIEYMIEIRTTSDNSHPETHSQNSDWHNGYFIGKLTNPGVSWNTRQD